MSDYTPTTEQVRLDYVMAYSEKESSQILAGRDFDRWLAEVERKAAEKAWDRCVSEMPIDLDWKSYYGDNNPYRRERTMTKRLTCKERDAILLDPATGRPADEWSVHSSLTDLSGEFGEPLIMTTWERDGRLIQDIRHPDANGGKDVAPCEHYELPREENDND